jgi:hypothetical protein
VGPMRPCLRTGRDADISYHWKDFVRDVKEGCIGTLGSDAAFLEHLKERLLRKVWTFVTPKGRKTRLQFIGSLLINESKPVWFVPKWNYNVFYYVHRPVPSFSPTRTALEKLMRSATISTSGSMRRGK